MMMNGGRGGSGWADEEEGGSNFETAVGKGLMTSKEREDNGPCPRAHSRLTVSWRNLRGATCRYWVADCSVAGWPRYVTDNE
jgi:hypothetical protein